jgi:hypothetical protein
LGTSRRCMAKAYENKQRRARLKAAGIKDRILRER